MSNGALKIKTDSGWVSIPAGAASPSQVSTSVSAWLDKNADKVLVMGLSDPSVELDDNGLFAVETNEFYFVEANATAIGTEWTGRDFTIKLYDESKTLISTQYMTPNGNNLGSYGVYLIGNVNNEYNGNRVARFKITDATVKYASAASYVSSVSLKGIYHDRIPQPELDRVDIYNTYLDAANSADFERKMRNYQAKYKRFRGIYRREQDGDILQTTYMPYGRPQGHGEVAHYYKYYDTEGDYLLYLYDTPTGLDGNIASKGMIVYFDGTTLKAEPNPLWREGNVRRHDHYDVCIVGGGSGGFGAAYALKDSGYKVCLVERLDSLGGTNLNGGVIRQIASPVGDWYKEFCREGYSCNGFFFDTSTKSIESGDRTEDDFDKLWRGSMLNNSTTDLGNLCTTNPYYFRQAYEDALKETVDILYNREVVDSKVVDGKIVYAVFKNTKTGGVETISAEYFIDCTANLCLLRCNQTEGTDFYIGSDADLYGEAAYKSGAVADKYEINTLEQAYEVFRGSTEYGNVQHNNRIVRWTKDYTSFPDDSGVTSGAVNGDYIMYWITPDGQSQISTIRSAKQFYGKTVSPGRNAAIPASAIIDEGYDYARTVGIRKAMAHAKKYNGGNYTGIFTGVMPMLAIRETYRMKCDYMLTQKDIETLITSSDLADKHIIALSSWYCDVHNPTTLTTSAVTPAWLNGIPYEALIPTCYKNALVACRGLGASHVGAAAFRLIRTMLSVGYAAGKAIKQARDGWLNDVRDIDIAALQAEVEIAEQMADIENNILPSRETVTE